MRTKVTPLVVATVSALSLLALSAALFGIAGPGAPGATNADESLADATTAEPQTLDDLLKGATGLPRLVVMGTFSGPVAETTEQIVVPGRPSLVEVQTSSGPKMVPPPPLPALTVTYYELTVERVLYGDAQPGDQLRIADSGPASLSGQERGRWRVPASGDRWLVLLAADIGPDEVIRYRVPSYWQFDVSGPEVKFAGTVPAATEARLLGGRTPDEFAVALAELVKRRATTP